MSLAGEYEPSPAKWVREQVEQYEASNGVEANAISGRPVVIVTHLGKKSGKLRKTPLMRVEHKGTYAAVASKGGAPKHPVWYWNLKANPRVTLRDKDQVGEYTVREVTGEERERWWRRAVEAWPPYDGYQSKTDRQIPVLVLEPRNQP